MHSILTITDAADDLQLLTIEEMRAAAGVTGSGQDDALTALGLRIAADICSECNIAIGIGAPPTLMQETCSEVFRGVRSDYLILARRHDVTITSIVVDGITLDPAEYEVDPESGLVTRLSGDTPTCWSGSKITVVYDAGFEEIPADLAHAATDFFRLAWSERSRDPAVKAIEIDVEDIDRVRTDYWAGALPGRGEGAVPEVVSGQLKRFRNMSVI